jgi:type I restriction enzyme S subunit
MSFELTKTLFSELVVVTDYVANGSFASLKENVTYLDQDGYAILVRLVDHNAGWKGAHVYVGKSAYEFLSKSSLLAGDVVVANVGANAGSVFRVPKLSRPATLGPNAVRVRPKHEVSLTKNFLYYYLASPVGQEKIQSIITGSAQPKFNKTALRSLNIEIPDVGVQKKVASFMMSIDDRITLLRETNTTLEAIAQALFKSWFVDFDPVHAKMQGRTPEGMDEATAALFPNSFVESELGALPKGWHIGRLDDLLVLQRGFDLPAQDRTPGDFPIIAASGSSGTHHKSMVKGPGVVTGRSGVLGRVFLELEDFWPLNTTLWVKKFKAATPCYAYEVLRLLDFKSFNAGSAVPSLNRNHIHGLPYLLPARECVDTFEVIASQIHKRCRVNERQIQTLVDIRDALLPRLISGQLRTPETRTEMESV